MEYATFKLLFGLSIISVAVGFVCTPYAVIKPTQVSYPYYLGETELNVTKYTQPDSAGKSDIYNFINLHENENTSVVAAKALIYQKGGGSIVFLQHGGARQITFMFDGVEYTIDPNRMFTLAGIQANLTPYNSTAAELVLGFAGFVLTIYDFENQEIVLALHNNAPTYSATDYLPGGPYADQASKVHIGDLFIPRDFYYIANGLLGQQLYNCLTAEGLSAVLQVPYTGSNSVLTDDGSLSVYAAIHNKPYVNTECAAESGSEGNGVINQLILLDHLTTQVANIGKT